MVIGKEDIAGVSLERRNQRFGGVVPDLDRLVVRGGDEIGLVRSRVVVHMVDSLGFVSLERLVCPSGPQIPNLDRLIQARRGKHTRIFGIDGETRDVVHSFSQLNILIVISSEAVSTKGCVGWTMSARM